MYSQKQKFQLTLQKISIFFFFSIFTKTKISKKILYIHLKQKFLKHFYISLVLQAYPKNSLVQLKTSISLYFSTFWNNFSHTQIDFFFHLQDDFCIVLDHIFNFYFSFLQKDFYIIHKQIETFHFSLLQKALDTFNETFFEAFLWFLIIPINFYIY